MGPLQVGGREPGVGDLLHLPKLPGLNVADGNALRRTPLDEGLSSEFGPVVDTYPRRATVQPHAIIQDADHAGARNRRPDLNREGLPITFVEDVEGPEAPAVVEGIGHEIEGPGLVEARRRDEGLAEPRGHAPARAPRQSEPQGAGHAMDALMVPPMPGPAQAMEALPEAPPTVPPDHVIQRGDDVAVPPQPGAWGPVVRRRESRTAWQARRTGTPCSCTSTARTSRFADGVIAFGSRRP